MVIQDNSLLSHSCSLVRLHVCMSAYLSVKTRDVYLRAVWSLIGPISPTQFPLFFNLPLLAFFVFLSVILLLVESCLTLMFFVGSTHTGRTAPNLLLSSVKVRVTNAYANYISLTVARTDAVVCLSVCLSYVDPIQ